MGPKLIGRPIALGKTSAKKAKAPTQNKKTSAMGPSLLLSGPSLLDDLQQNYTEQVLQDMMNFAKMKHAGADKQAMAEKGRAEQKAAEQEEEKARKSCVGPSSRQDSPNSDIIWTGQDWLHSLLEKLEFCHLCTFKEGLQSALHRRDTTSKRR